MASALSIEGLTKRFRAATVLDGVALEVAPGELFFLLGPSGCGKTTLLRCLAGLCQPDAGRVRLDGLDITELPPHRREMALVFQSYAIWPHLTVRQNVAFPLEMRRLHRDEIERRTAAMLERVRLLDRAAARPAELSGGQQQRVALARALVAEPRCLLLDEPLSNLDARLRIDMRTEIRRLCKDAGLTAVYVTHDQKEAMSIADRIAILHEGRLQQCGRPEDVYQRPASRFVAGFIGETNFLDGRVVQRDPNRLRIDTPVGPVDAATAPPAAVPGATVTLSLRPEAFSLVSEPPPGANCFDGVVLNTTYLGDAVRQDVRLGSANGPLIQVFELRASVRARDGDAVPVRVAIDPADVVVLTE